MKKIICVCIIIILVSFSLPSATIYKVQIDSLPTTKPNGAQWDAYFGGPDVGFILFTPSRKVVYISDIYRDVAAIDYPLIWEVQISIELEENYKIFVYDDDITKDDFMDGLQMFTIAKSETVLTTINGHIIHLFIK
jgi:hypothetical protein